jgi:parallel beta-helix repeat protein
MPQDANIFVKGGIVCNGTSDNPVEIALNESTGAAQWGALCIVNPTSSSVFKHFRMTGGSICTSNPEYSAALFTLNSDLELDGVYIKAPFTPVYAQYGKVSIINSEFFSSGTCDLVHLKYCIKPIVENCELKGNTSFDTDGIDYDQVTDGIIRLNKIRDFCGPNNDGIDIGESCKGIIIEKNQIVNCFDKGISVGQGSDVIIRDNIMISCDMGIGVKDTISFAEIINCTFYSNNYGIKCYEKHPGSGGGHASVSSSIFTANVTEPYDFDRLSGITFKYSLCDNRKLDGTGNIKDNPMFADTEKGDFSLASGSPCIDAGDPDGEPDSDGSRADMGARNLGIVLGSKNPGVGKTIVITRFIRSYPNPFTSRTVISFGIPSENQGLVKLEIFDAKGRLVRKLLDRKLGRGIYNVEFDGANLGSGIYYCRLSTDKFRNIHRMYLIK